MVRWICVVLALLVSPVVAQPYGGPPDGADYWTVQGFKDFPIKGPSAAKGIVLWSHGVYRREAQYQFSPAPVVLRFARAGWDVIKVQRNPRNERGWIPSGVRHVNDLVERANKAKADGYRQIIAAGQSYGGVISIEASGKTASIDAVLALAPGHGSDATTDSSRRIFDGLTDQLIGAINKAQAPRLLVMIAENDVYHPFEVRGPKIKAALERRGKPFILFDETMPLKGHGAGGTPQFDQWYGVCILAFFTKADARQGETRCAGPLMSGKFALPTDVKIEPPAGFMPPAFAALSGRWSGSMTGGNGVMMIFEKIEVARVNFVYAVDSGPEGKTAPYWARRTASVNGSNLESRNRTGPFSIVFPPPSSEGMLNVVITGPKGETYNATLRRETGS